MQWNKSITGFDLADSGIRAKFQNGSVAEGKLLVGADGATSKLRRILCPETGGLNQLPIKFLGVTLKLSPEAIAPLRALDPLLFQGCHPETGTFFWFSTLDTPEVNGSKGDEEYYSAQLNISWPSEDDVPSTNDGKLAKMKALAVVFEQRLRTTVHNIPDDTEVIEIKLADWPCLEWPSYDGKVTLIGDAAHAMTMCKSSS